MLRSRPVVSFAGRYARKPFELGEYRLPVGTRILLAAILTHYDPDLFPHPERFDPERFVNVTPDTYSWIPFGGKIRRCIGASFAQMEMDVVLRVMLERVELMPTEEPPEAPAFRGVVWAPARGGRLVMRKRAGAPARVGARVPPCLQAEHGRSVQRAPLRAPRRAGRVTLDAGLRRSWRQAFALAHSALPAPPRDLP